MGVCGENIAVVTSYAFEFKLVPTAFEYLVIKF